MAIPSLDQKFRVDFGHTAPPGSQLKEIKLWHLVIKNWCKFCSLIYNQVPVIGVWAPAHLLTSTNQGSHTTTSKSKYKTQNGAVKSNVILIDSKFVNNVLDLDNMDSTLNILHIRTALTLQIAIVKRKNLWKLWCSCPFGYLHHQKI